MTDRHTAEEQLRTQIRTALHTAGISQAEASRRLGLSTKHVNQMLTGKATLTLHWVEQLAALTGARVLAYVTVPPGAVDREQRVRLDALNDDVLDRLYDDLDRAHEVIGELNDRNTRPARRATRRNP